MRGAEADGLRRLSGTNRSLAPYRPWEPRPLTEVGFARHDDLIDGLISIVESEGPMHALRAYQLYVKAAGGHRVGKEVRRLFNQAVNRALRTHRLAQINDSVPGQVGKTLYMPGAPQIAVRDLGPRELTEVPRSEVQALIAQLGLDGTSAQVKRSVLAVYGLTRLTERANVYLDECLQYEYLAEAEPRAATDPLSETP
jgi:hypothetical protein